MSSLEWITLIILFLGVTAGLSQIKQLPQDQKYLTYFIITTFILEVIADYYLSKGKNNLFFYHLFIPFQYLYLSFVFHENIKNNTVKIIIKSSMVFVFILEIYLVNYYQSPHTTPSILILTTRLFLLIWVLIYLQSLLNNPTPQPLSSIPIFWVSMGVLIYIVNLFSIGLTQFLIRTQFELANYWQTISLWFDVVFYILCIAPLFNKLYLKYSNK